MELQPVNNILTYKLLDLMERTGYPIVQHNGQRKFGPPADWSGPPPQKGCEVFIGKLPREIFEDELVPLFSTVGRIYEMRLMMDFSGSNRGYAFVTFASRMEAYSAVRELNGYEIRPGKHIGVVKSVDNCRLFVGNIPKNKTKEEVFEELSKRVTDIVDVILYKNCFDRKLNRGFAFVEFASHRAAAMARRALVPGCVKLWDQEVMVDWAEPEPDIDDEQMTRVKILYARNFQVGTSSETIQSFFEKAINGKIERVKKIYDYAFIHFFTRADAELAMSKLQNAEIDGTNIEIRWAKPVERELYRIQKLKRGNAKFNNSLDLSQTLMLYKQHLDKKEYAISYKDEGIGSACGSPEGKLMPQYPPRDNYYSMAPAKLDAMCKRYNWAAPIYEYQKFQNTSGEELWVAKVELPLVGPPLLAAARRVGPLASAPGRAPQLAAQHAAHTALHCLRMLRMDSMANSSPVPHMYPALMPPMPCVTPYDYSSLYAHPPPMPITMPPVWRTV